MMHLNNNIKLIRELSGKKQADFARLIKTNLSNLKTYENTNVKPKANVLVRIAAIGGVEMDDLLNKSLTSKDISVMDDNDASFAEGPDINLERVPPGMREAMQIILKLTNQQEKLIDSNVKLVDSHASLVKQNEKLVDKISSGETGSVSEFAPEGGKEVGVEYRQLSGKISPDLKKKKRKGISV